MKLRKNADTSHEEPEDWYGAYGAHISTKFAGDVCIQEVDPDWLIECEDDQDLIEAHRGPIRTLTKDEFAELVSRARSVWEAACNQWHYRELAVDAYRQGDLVRVEACLNMAALEERQHGDDPAARALRKQLLEETSASTICQLPDPGHSLSLHARDLWDAYGGKWDECGACGACGEDGCSLESWHACGLMQKALVDAGKSGSSEFCY